MFGIPPKKDERRDPDGVRVIKATRPGECGGTDATLDERAPKEIASNEMTLFDVDSALNGDYMISANGDRTAEYLGYVSAFAAPARRGSFLFLETSGGFRRGEDRIRSLAYVREDVFPALCALVRSCGLAKQNGYHSTTHGLPENFGGSVMVKYRSGEKISFSDNQTPILTFETGEKIVRFFRNAMEGEQIALPDPGSLTGIVYDERRKQGGFTHAHLTINGDGAATNEKEACYDGKTVYKSSKPVDAETVAAIRRKIAEKGIFAWADLSETTEVFDFSPEKTLRFLFEDNSEILLPDDRLLPQEIRGGFFDIELEMTTKH